MRTGVTLLPEWDRLVPFGGPVEPVREILSVLPPERREAVVFNRLDTDWGPNAERALNSFWEGLRVLDLAPSLRVATFVVKKLRNNRSHFKKRLPEIEARLASLAAVHPAVAQALKPQRGKAPTTVPAPSPKPSRKKAPASGAG